MHVLLHPSDHPVFRLRGAVSHCGVEVRVNDVPVHRDMTGRAHDFDIAVNEWLFQGVNTIDVHLAPLEQGAPMTQEAALDLRLMHKVAREAVRNAVEIGLLSWRPEPPPLPGHAPHVHGAEEMESIVPHEDAEEFSPLLALPGQSEELHWAAGAVSKLPEHKMVVRSTLSLPPPWPVCPWSTGTQLGSQAGVQHALQNMLRSLHQMLRLGGWRELMKRRTAAVQAAYHLGADEVDDALGFPSLLGKPGWNLQALPESGLALETAGQGRLVRLVDTATGDSPVVLVNEAAELSAIIQCWWMFDKEWSIVR